MNRRRNGRASQSRLESVSRPTDLGSLRGSIVAIEKLIPEGKGLGRLADGRVVLAQAVTPGDRIEIEQGRVSRGCVSVVQWGLADSSAVRVEPRCEYWRQCGGCDWMMLESRQQAVAKRALVEEALRRTGKFELDSEQIEPCRQAATDAYRSRIRLHIDGSRLGFFARASHELVQPGYCLVTSPVLNLAMAELRVQLQGTAEAAESFESVELRECSDGRVSLSFTAKKLTGSQAARAASADKHWRAGQQLQRALSSRFLVAMDADQTRNPQSWQRFAVTNGANIYCPPGGFTQIHWEMNRCLIGLAMAGVQQRSIRTFLDLYCGAGNFTLPLLELGLSGTAVEGNELSVAAARHGAQLQGAAERVALVAGDVPQFTASLLQHSESFDLVLIDPPRAGVSSGLLEMVQLSRGWLLMCSCNPVTLARDLRILVDAGCILESIQPLDLFPQTHHVETLVWLRSPACVSSAPGRVPSQKRPKN